MTDKEIEKARELIGAVVNSIEMQQEILKGLELSLQQYVQYLNAEIKELEKL